MGIEAVTLAIQNPPREYQTMLTSFQLLDVSVADSSVEGGPSTLRNADDEQIT
jgi:hypothetical protein